MNDQTKKERREAAHKARLELQKARQRARRRKKISLIAVIALVVGVLGYLGVTSYIEGKKTEKQVLSTIKQSWTQAGCTDIRKITELPASPHLTQTDPPPSYNSNPPTSGQHFGTTAPWGFVDQKIDDRITVHNLEHGGIVIHYRQIPSSDVSELRDLVDEVGDGIVLEPDPAIKDKLAMASWGRLQTCEKVDLKVVRFFVKQNCNKGPEDLALECSKVKV
ncbi:MAG TPA: DUF3105 domain-containing protein [Actinomycetota bacterium]|nr:DUF3105 domain-containing protein [Actinomycetota bacterium]